MHKLRAVHFVGNAECDSSDEEYSRLLTLAVSFVAVWPVGIPLLFLMVLLNCREAIMQGRMSPLVRSTSFLHRECAAVGFELALPVPIRCTVFEFVGLMCSAV
eukprot:5470550-Prymnesium_polylepis.1